MKDASKTTYFLVNGSALHMTIFYFIGIFVILCVEVAEHVILLVVTFTYN